VNEAGTVVWQYNASPPKAFRYTCDDPGIIAILGNNPCGLTTGVQEHGEAGINVFPNPSTGAFTLTGLDPNEVSSIAVLDAMGREVLRTLDTQRIDLDDRADGLYTLQIMLPSGTRIIKKIAVQR
jgi:hypothetical protein